MRRVFAVFMIFIIIMRFDISAAAHSGRTDENGGHYDNKKQSYHYHHGQPAHQHPNGECPYNKSENSEVTETVAPPERKDSNKTKDGKFDWIIFFVSVICIAGVWFFIKKRTDLTFG